MLIYKYLKRKIKFKKFFIYFLLLIIVNLIALNQYLNKILYEIDGRQKDLSLKYINHSACHLAIITNWSPAYIKPNPKAYINQFSRNLAYSININKIFNQNNCLFHIFSLKHYSQHKEHDYYASFVTPIYLNDQPFSIGIKKLSNLIESKNFTSVLIQQHDDVAANKWQLLDLANNLPLRVKVYFVLHSVPPYPDIEYLGIIRQIAVRANNLIVLTWNSYYSLIYGYGIDREKLLYIPHGVTFLDDESKSLDMNNILDNFNKNDNIIISSPGLIQSDVEFYRFIRNFYSIQKKIPSLKYLIVGKEINASNKMKNLIKYINKCNLTNEIIWIDEILDNVKLASLFSKSRAFLSLNDDDYQINSYLLDAMYYNLPIISTSTRFGTEFLSNNRGLIVPFENDELLINLIIDMLSNQNLTKIYANNSKKYTKNISWDNISGKKKYFILFFE
jgi:hypothetical protein